MSKTLFATPKLKTNADTFVKGAASRTTTDEKMVRLTLDLTPELHRRMKIKALDLRMPMTALIRKWMEENC